MAFVGVKRIHSTIKNVQYMSDIHLEYRTGNVPFIPVVSNSLVLAGDIGNPFKYNYKEFLVKCSNEYENTFVLPGNHEYWGNDIRKTDDQIESLLNRLNNVHSLKNAVVEANNVTFIGCTLWSNILKEPLVRRGDEQNISLNGSLVNWVILNELHFSDVSWLKSTLQARDARDTRPVIVVTHYLPTYKLLHPYYNTPRYQNDLDRYYTNLEHLIKPPIKAWIGGHSHCVMEIELNGVGLRVNAIGYPGKTERKEGLAKSIQLT